MDNKISSTEIWGVLGGMGPHASAEFVKTIYAKHADLPEQQLPVVLLLSDPRVPDRTGAFLHGGDQMLLGHLTERVTQLLVMGATKIIVCCVTIHPLIEELDPLLRGSLVSLVDVIFDCVVRKPEPSLLLCTEGTRKMEIFQKHSSWTETKSRIIMPNQDDQKLIHNMIYEIKVNRREQRHTDFLEQLLARYGVNSYIAGCTELHILVREQERVTGRKSDEFCIDPLNEIAGKMIPQLHATHHA